MPPYPSLARAGDRQVYNVGLKDGIINGGSTNGGVGGAVTGNGGVFAMRRPWQKGLPEVEPMPYDNEEVFDDRGYPVVEAIRDDLRGFLKFYCRYCKAWHFHGAGDGHRVAHCWYDDSPYLQHGYVLRENPAKSEV